MLRQWRARRRVRADFAAAPAPPEVVVRPGRPPEALPAEPARYETTHVVAGQVTDAVPLARALAAVADAAVITCDAMVGSTPLLRPGPSPERDEIVDPTAGGCLVRRDLADDPWAAVREHGRVHVPRVLGLIDTPPPVRAVRVPIPTEPSVEVIVPFRDRPDLLQRCLAALDRTGYERMTITLVDNGSTDRAVCELLAGRHVVRDERPFNFSALNNSAAAASQADVLVFLNNDTEVTRDWLEPLLAYALRPDIGAVAPLLLTPEGRVQHTGAVVGIHGTAGHPFAGLWPDTPTAFGTAAEPRNWLAVTAACLAIERREFEGVGGFDTGFVIAGQDVDLGLRLHARGLRSFCTPESVVLHDESASRAALGHDEEDVRLSRERYEPFLSQGDPYYHPALTLERTDCGFR